MSVATATTVTIYKSLALNGALTPEQDCAELVPLYKIPNVVKYHYASPGVVLLERGKPGEDAVTPTTLLMIDTLYDDAFGHWVYESAIYLPMFQRLKKLKLYPDLKLHSKSRRRYKTLFYDFFGISEVDIVYGENAATTAIVPLPISAWNDKEPVSETYKHYVDELFQAFCGVVGTIPKSISVLLSPRGRNENYMGNDRQMDVTEVIENLRSRSDAVILHTDQVRCLETDQIRHIAAAKTLILMDGSAYYVNGLFARKSEILVVGGCCVLQHNQEFPKMNYVHQKILVAGNTVRFPCGFHKVPYASVARYLR